MKLIDVLPLNQHATAAQETTDAYNNYGCYRIFRFCRRLSMNGWLAKFCYSWLISNCCCWLYVAMLLRHNSPSLWVLILICRCILYCLICKSVCVCISVWVCICCIFMGWSMWIDGCVFYGGRIIKKQPLFIFLGI